MISLVPKQYIFFKLQFQLLFKADHVYSQFTKIIKQQCRHQTLGIDGHFLAVAHSASMVHFCMPLSLKDVKLSNN